MSKYKFIKERDLNDSFDITEVTVSVDSVQLEDLIEEFQNFLLASGFRFDGNLEIVDLQEGTDD